MPRMKARPVNQTQDQETIVAADLSASASDTSTKTRKPRQPRKRKTRDVSDEMLAKMHDPVAATVIGASMAMPQELRPTDSEIDGTFMPLERIVLRHTPLPAAHSTNPDVHDAQEAAISFGKYALRALVFPAIEQFVTRIFARRNRAKAPLAPNIPNNRFRRSAHQDPTFTAPQQAHVPHVPQDQTPAPEPEPPNIEQRFYDNPAGTAGTPANDRTTPGLKAALDPYDSPLGQLGKLHGYLESATPAQARD